MRCLHHAWKRGTDLVSPRRRWARLDFRTPLIVFSVFIALSAFKGYAQYHNIYGSKQREHQRLMTSGAPEARPKTKNPQISSQRSNMSGAPSAELVLIGPGASIYTRFGHVAIRIRSATRDLVYDLGVGQYGGTRGFNDQLWGRAEFSGVVRSFPKMLNKWKRSDRDVSVYPLNLNDQLIGTLYRELEARVGGRIPPYLYDPFRENCATQLRHVLDSVTQGLISRVGQRYPNQQSFRDEVNHGYAQTPSLLMVIELLAGVSLDRSRTLWELSAIPKYLVKLLKQISQGGQPLLGEVRHLYLRRAGSPVGGVGRYIPLLLTLAMLTLLFFPIWSRYRNPGIEFNSRYQKFFRVMMRVAPTALAAASLLAVILTLKSGWIEVRNSWQLYMCSPLDLSLLLVGPGASLAQIKWGKWYLIFRGISSLILTITASLYFGATPPIVLSLLLIGGWLSCFMNLGVLEAKLLREDYERSLKATSRDEIPWIQSEPVDFL